MVWFASGYTCVQPACTNEADEGRAMHNAAGRPLVHALPCYLLLNLLAAPAASWGDAGIYVPW